MQTSRPSLTPRLSAIRQAVARGDYSGLADGGEREVFAYARQCGVGPAELLHEWAGDTMAAEVLRNGSAKASKTAHIEVRSLDLDYWPPDIEGAQPVDDGDEEPCEACHGTGLDDDGQPCEVCGGSGKAALNEDEDDDNLEEE